MRPACGKGGPAVRLACGKGGPAVRLACGKRLSRRRDAGRHTRRRAAHPSLLAASPPKMDITSMNQFNAISGFQQQSPFVVQSAGNAFFNLLALFDGDGLARKQVMSVPIIHERTQCGSLLPFIENRFKGIEKCRQHLFAVP